MTPESHQRGELTQLGAAANSGHEATKKGSRKSLALATNEPDHGKEYGESDPSVTPGLVKPCCSGPRSDTMSKP